MILEEVIEVLETLKLGACRTEREALDIAINKLKKDIDLVSTIKDIKDNVYKQGRRDERKATITEAIDRLNNLIDEYDTDNKVVYPLMRFKGYLEYMRGVIK